MSRLRYVGVALVAGTVGGIFANSSRPAEFIYDNMLIHATVVHAAHQYAVKKLLYLGSSCIYPRMAPQPMKEEHLLTGLLEELPKRNPSLDANQVDDVVLGVVSPVADQGGDVDDRRQQQRVAEHALALEARQHPAMDRHSPRPTGDGDSAQWSLFPG